MICLRTGKALLEIAPRGAEVVRWTVNGTDLIWQGDPNFWDRSAPVLFPVVGRCSGGNIRLGGTLYPMPVHGFAPGSDFTPLAVTDRTARFVLRDSPASHVHWPFSFELTVDLELADDGFRQTLTIGNAGQEPMPYACGLHPGFRWPFAGGAAEDYEVAFARGVSARVPEITPDGLFRDASRVIHTTVREREQCLTLRHDLFAREALCFLNSNAEELIFRRRGGVELRITMTGFPHFALWSRGGGAFLCLESWTGHGDPEGFDGDAFAKPSMLILAPGAKATHGAHYQVAGV